MTCKILYNLKHTDTQIYIAPKIVRTSLVNVDSLDCVSFFQRYTRSYTRGDVMKLIKPRVMSARHCQYHFFTNRTIYLWNSLPDSTVTVPVVD